MNHLIIKQIRVPYKEADWRGIKYYMRSFLAIDKRHKSHAGAGVTQQQAIRDLGRRILQTTSLDDETGRLDQGWKYSRCCQPPSKSLKYRLID